MKKIEEFSDEELINELLFKTRISSDNEYKNYIKKELLKRLQTKNIVGYTCLDSEKEKAVEEYKKRLIKEIERCYIIINGNPDAVDIIKNIINNLK